MLVKFIYIWKKNTLDTLPEHCGYLCGFKPIQRHLILYNCLKLLIVYSANHFVAQWHHVASEKSVNIGPRNGWLPDGIKPKPEPLLTSSQGGFCGIHLRAISQRVPKLLKSYLKITATSLSGQWLKLWDFICALKIIETHMAVWYAYGLSCELRVPEMLTFEYRQKCSSVVPS